MSTEKLIVRNFGPIKEAEIDLKKVTIFIGEQAGGKSTLAKLVALVKENDCFFQPSRILSQGLDQYSIKTFLQKNTYIEYSNDDFSFFIKPTHNQEITHTAFIQTKNSYFDNLYKDFKKLENDLSLIIDKKSSAVKNQKYDEAKALKEKEYEYLREISLINEDLNDNTSTPLYYPAERHFLSSIAGSLINMNKNDIPLPKSILNFGSLYEQALSYLSTADFERFDLSYNHNDRVISYKGGKSTKIQYSSSGIQSILPILMVTSHIVIENQQNDTFRKHKLFSFIVEEPELNLYPTTQKKLVEYLLLNCCMGRSSLIITTHSPYILSTFDNCIQAGNAVKTRPELKEKVEAILPSKYHLDYDDVAVYYVAGGTVKLIMNEEYKGIDTNAIDDVSENLGSVFDELLALQYQD